MINGDVSFKNIFHSIDALIQKKRLLFIYSQICEYQLSPDEKNKIFLQRFLAKIFMDSLAGQFIVMFDMIDISRKSNA